MARGNVLLPVHEHEVRFPPAVSAFAVLGEKVDLEFDGLEEFKLQQLGVTKRLGHGPPMSMG
jgi:hypothetical protein